MGLSDWVDTLDSPSTTVHFAVLRSTDAPTRYAWVGVALLVLSPKMQVYTLCCPDGCDANDARAFCATSQPAFPFTLSILQTTPRVCSFVDRPCPFSCIHNLTSDELARALVLRSAAWDIASLELAPANEESLLRLVANGAAAFEPLEPRRSKRKVRAYDAFFTWRMRAHHRRPRESDPPPLQAIDDYANDDGPDDGAATPHDCPLVEEGDLLGELRRMHVERGDMEDEIAGIVDDLFDALHSESSENDDDGDEGALGGVPDVERTGESDLAPIGLDAAIIDVVEDASAAVVEAPPMTTPTDPSEMDAGAEAPLPPPPPPFYPDGSSVEPSGKWCVTPLGYVKSMAIIALDPAFQTIGHVAFTKGGTSISATCHLHPRCSLGFGIIRNHISKEWMAEWLCQGELVPKTSAMPLRQAAGQRHRAMFARPL